MFKLCSKLFVAFPLVAIMILQHAVAETDIHHYVQKRPTSTVNKYCGKHLSNALQLVCNGAYNPMFKKSRQEIEIDDFPFSYDEEFPSKSRGLANAIMARFSGGSFRRLSRGVHDECCMNPCSVEDLSSYCAM